MNRAQQSGIVRKGNPDLVSMAIMVIVNFVPLYGVLFEEWDGVAVISLYLLETVVIGAFHAARMLFYKLFGIKALDGKVSLGIILFFMFHFFFFIFVQSALFFGFAEGSYPGLSNGFKVIHNFNLFLVEPYIISVYFFVSAQLIYSIREMTQSHLFEKMKIENYMFLPYTRIFIQQFVVIFGAMIYMASGSILWVVVLLILLKILGEYLGLKFGVEWVIKSQNKA